MTRIPDTDAREQANARLGARVLRHRTRADLTQDELAARCGYTRQMISMIERGLTAVSGPGLLALSAALGVRPEALVSPRKGRK
jgi:transcriptional regulator with XRE-family HTH domain